MGGRGVEIACQHLLQGYLYRSSNLSIYGEIVVQHHTHHHLGRSNKLVESTQNSPTHPENASNTYVSTYYFFKRTNYMRGRY